MSRDMVEIRLHGRGGQGVILAANLVAEIAFLNGYMPQSFPFFGAERRGAPVIAFVRYSRESCLPRCRIYEPYCVVGFDTDLPRDAVLEGLQQGGLLLLNGRGVSLRSWIEEASSRRCFALDATRIAADLGLLSSGMPLVSMAMVGALARVLSLGEPKTMQEIIQRKITRHVPANIEAMQKGYHAVEEVFLDACAG